MAYGTHLLPRVGRLCSQKENVFADVEDGILTIRASVSPPSDPAGAEDIVLR
jgi:hypothetical protein